jgi:membrane-associated phospholipid phosphatase
MKTPRDLAAEVLQAGSTAEQPNIAYKLARLISSIFHPMILGAVCFLVVGFAALPQQRLIGIVWALFGVLIQITPGVIFYTIRLRQGAYSDVDVSVRHQRHELYLFGVGVLVVNLIVLSWLRAPVDFLALLSSAFIISVCAWIVNIYWKISVHALSAGTCAAIATIYVPSLGVVLWLCALLVGWARVQTHNHTPLQVAAGLGLAVVGVGLVFHFFGVI